MVDLVNDLSRAPSQIVSELNELMAYALKQNWQNEYLNAASHKLNLLTYDGHVDEAKILYKEVKSLAEKLDNTEIATSARIDYLRLQVSIADFTEVDAIVKELLAKVPHLESEFYRASIYSALGFTYRKMRNYADALNYYQKAVKHFQELNDTGGMTEAMSALGGLSVDTNEYELALEYYNEALRLSRADQDRISESVILYSMAYVHSSQGDLELAQQILKESLDISLDVGDLVGVAYTQQELARIFMTSKRWDEALSLLKL